MLEVANATGWIDGKSFAFDKNIPTIRVGADGRKFLRIAVCDKPFAHLLNDGFPGERASLANLARKLSSIKVKRILAVNPINGKEFGKSEDRGKERNERDDEAIRVHADVFRDRK